MSAENLWLVSKKFANCLRSLFLAKLHRFIEFEGALLCQKNLLKEIVCPTFSLQNVGRLFRGNDFLLLEHL